MKRFVCYGLVLALLALLPSGTIAAEKTFKLITFAGEDNRHLGSRDVGDIGLYGLSLYVDDPATHARMLGLEFSQYENSVDGGTGLVLPENEFSLGVSLPVAEHCGLRLAITQQQFLNDDPFSSFGVYPHYDVEHLGVEMGFERDQETDFSFLVGKAALRSGTMFVGVSRERFDVQRAELQTFRYERTGAGYLAHVPQMQVHAFTGGNYNWDEEKPTWVAGVSRYAALHGTGANPAVLAVYRHKPESSYSLGILTLGGRSINEHVSAAIQEAFFVGGLKRSRIIGSRYFDTPGIGSSYEMQDFGTFSLATSFLSVEAGRTAQLVSRDVSGYATYPKELGPVTHPFVGVTWAEFSDLIYDPAVHALSDPEQRYWEFKVGAKIPLHERGDRRHQLGYLRLGLKANTNGGLAVKATTWF